MSAYDLRRSGRRRAAGDAAAEQGRSRVQIGAALGGVIGAVALAAFLLFGGGGASYTVKATFISASQLIEGNQVQVGGVPAGSVEKVDVTPDGQAEITLEIDDRYAPLHRGTRAVIRQASQSGVVNRFVDLLMPDGRTTGEIENGGRIGVDETQTAVDIDQLFNTLDPETRKALQGVLQGYARAYAGRGAALNAGYRYLSPALSASGRVLGELNRDTRVLERFVVDSAALVGALADRRDDLAALVGNLNRTTRAIGRRKAALASALGRLPDFMRRANTTFVNLRGALDDVDPLVDASKPVVRKLGPLLAELRRFARDARLPVRDLNAVVLRAGAGNDLVELVRTFPPLARIAVDEAERSIDFGTGPKPVGRSAGALPETARALEDTIPIIAFSRPYTPDLFGWFDDFSTSGPDDAFGGTSRVALFVNAFTPQTGAPIDLSRQDETFRQLAKIGQFRRCPGAAEAPASDGSNVLSPEEQERFDCTEAHRAVTP